ncbi:FAD-dependent oxidoreductase [Salmonella enterica subsp. enterica serovar Typhi]|nr:FAD-dependent oxidoreductase [Salmonella enterica subsp. enterica serovar Typhi]
MYDFVIIGGGIIGMSTAMQLIDVYPDARIALLEKESAPACHQTGHNSGVIHAGVYYTPGSLKARFCLAGNQATKTFCDQNNIRYDTCGKMLVATSELEMARMRALWERTAANGLEREWLNAAELREREGYRKRDVSFTDTLEIFRSAGIRRVLQNHLLSGLGEMKNSLCKSGYLRRVQKYCPSLTVNDLQPWPAGVRAQAVSPDGKLIDDFLFVTTPRSIHTCNAPSPAATSAIPIGAHIVSKVQALRASQSNPGRTLRAARSVDALHAAFTR